MTERPLISRACDRIFLEYCENAVAAHNGDKDAEWLKTYYADGLDTAIELEKRNERDSNSNGTETDTTATGV